MRYGLQWFESFDECVDKFIDIAQTFEPDAKRHAQYEAYYKVYKDIYRHTHQLTEALLKLKINSMIINWSAMVVPVYYVKTKSF